MADFDEVYVGGNCLKLPIPFKRERKWFRKFEVFNQKHKTYDENIAKNLEKNSGG